MANLDHVTLADARKYERLQEFIAQQENRGIVPIDRSAFDALTAALVTAPQSENQTSRSASDDGSTGTKTPQDNEPFAEG